MKTMFERLRSAALPVVAFMLSATSAWGEMRPAAAWFGDFSSTQHANRNVTYTLSNISNGAAESNNTVQGDAEDGYYVQMNGSNGLKVKSNAATFGLTSSSGKLGFTALMLYSNYAADSDASTRDLLIGFHDNGATPSKEYIGVANYQNKAQGIWDNYYYETANATKSPTESTVFPTSATEAKTAVAFKFLRNSSRGAFYVKQSSGTTSSGEFGGLTGDFNISGVSFGGPNFTAHATKPLSMASGMKIHGIIMFHSLLTDTELSAWSLTGMTTMQKLTSSQELTSVGSSTALNLEANGGTFTVASDITAAAVFVQDYEQTITFTSGKITAPFYAGSAVTIDASNYDVSSMKDGDTIQLINGPVCGIELNDIVVPESTSSFVYYASKDSNGIYLNAVAQYDWKYVNINFYHDDTSKITTSAAIGLEGVAGTSWNNVPGTLGSNTGIVVLDGESHSFVDNRIVVAISNIQGSYQDANYAANSDLRRGFIHDHNLSYATPTVTISNVPFDEYRVIVYHSTDSNNGSAYAHFGYDTVNGINLTYGSGKLGIGDTQWGDTNDSSRSQPIAEGVNALVSGVYTNKTLTIVSHRMTGNTTRAGIAAIQIIKASVPTDDVAISITKPSSDWDSLTLPTTAKLYGICAASGSAAEESFGNNSTYLQTLGERSATVVVITNGVYTGINGLLKAGETISETRDSYVIMKGGTATIVKGRQVAPWGGSTTKNTTGNSFVQLEGDAVVGHVFGVGDQGGNSSTLTGLSGVTVKGDSIVLGSVIGGWSSAHQATPKVTAGTAVRIQNLQTKNYGPTLSADSVIPDNCIIGGSIVQWNVASHSQIDGDSLVKIDIESGTGNFSKRIIGASCIPDHAEKYGDNTVKGNSSVSISAPTTINFPYFIVGGGYNGYTGASSSSANVEKNSSVTLNSGTFSGTIVAGGYTADGVSGSANVQGIAKLIVNGGSFSSATLAGGNATQGKMLVANTAIDTSSVTVKGFDALEVGADVTQAAITQTSGEFTEITVHDGAQYTAATTGSSDLRVVSSTDGGTKGVVVFDGLASTYTGDITITSGSKAKLVSGTYTGTFTVETGASLEIDPGAGNTYACAASFTGAGNVVVKSGTVTFTGSNTLDNAITVEANAIAVAAVTGDEGEFQVLSGATLRLYVTTDQYHYEGNVFKGTNNGTVEYYHGTQSDYSDYVKITDSNSLNGNNLLPYYQIWKVVGEATEGAINTAANWPGAGAVPTVRGDETYGNAAFYVASGTVTVNIDATMNFSEIQIYGAGTVIFKSDGTHYLSANYLSMTAGVNVQISGGEALKLSNGEIISAQPSQTITINSGAKLSLDGVSCANRIICNGTLETAGATTLSSDNELAGSLNVTAGKTTIAFRSLYCGNWPNYAYLNIDSGSELEITSNNSIWSGGALGIYLKGTLTLDQSITLGTYTPIYLYPGASIGGNGTINLGESTLKNSTIYMYASGGDASASASISCPIALTSNSETANIGVEDGVTLVCSGNIIAASGKSLTKQGAGTLDLTAITPSSPMAIDAGKVVADEVPTATITINENGTFVLKDKAWAKGNADCFRGSGTLELYAATMEYGHDVEGVSFSGIVKVSNVTGKQNNFTGTAAMFASAPEFILDADKTHLGGGYYNNNDEHPFEVKNLSGSGNFKSQWDGYAHSYIIKTTQTKDTVFSGSFESNHSTGDRVMNLTVVGDGSGTVHSLTLTKAQNTSSADTAEAASTLKVSDGAKVVFTSTGGWGYGNVLVGNGGWLQSTNATAVTKLTLQTGSHLVLPTKTSQLTGVSTISASGTIKVHIADDTVPDVGTYLVDWSAASLANAPGGNFLLVGTAAEHVALEKDTTGLKVVAVVCTLTTNGETIGYTSLNDALSALYMARNADKDAYITIRDGSTPSAETIATWADASIGWDSENGKFYVIVVAQIGDDKYLSLADAITAAADSGDTIVLKIDCPENVNLGGKSVTFDESSATFSGTFTGNGTLIMTELPKAISTSSLWAEGWTGTLWLKGVTFPVIESGADAGKSVVNPVVFGNANSTLRLTSCSGGFGDDWTYDEDEDKFPGTLDLVDENDTPAFTVTSGWPAYGKTVFARLTGTGTLTSGNPSKGHYYQFLDASEFRGSITIPDNDKFRVGIGTVDATLSNGASISDKTLTIQSGASVTIASGKTWSAASGVVVDGTLTLAASTSTLTGTVTGSGRIVSEGFLPSVTGLTASGWTGTVEIKNYTETTDSFHIIKLNNYGNGNSAVALNCVTSTMYAVSGNYPAVTLREIEIGEGGWTDWEGGSYSDVTMLYTAKLTGHGPLTVKTGGSGTVMFVGEHTFDGSVSFGASAGKQVAFMQTSSALAVTAKAIVVDEGLEMSVASGKTWTANGGFVINGTLNVAGTLASGAATAVSGTGTVVFDGKLPSPTGAAWWGNDAWDGTVWLKNQAVADFEGTTYGNEGSTVRFTGVTGYLQTSSYNNSTYVHTVPLELVDDGDTVAFTYNNGYGGSLVKLNTLKGTGTLKTQGSGAGEHIYIVDASGFAGVFNLTAKSVYVGGSTPDYSDSTGMSGKLEIRDGTTLTVPSDMTWTANSGFVVNGTLNVNGTLASSAKSVSGSGTVVFTGKLPPSDAAANAWWKSSAWTGKVEIKNYREETASYHIIILNNYGNVNSTVALNDVESTMYAKSGDANYPAVTLKEIEIGEGGWSDWEEGSYGTDMLYTAKLTGHGPITVKSGGEKTVKFVGEHTFDGSVAFGDSAQKQVAFMRTSSDTLPTSVTAKAVIVAGRLNMSIASGKTWTAPGGVKIDGSLTVRTDEVETATSVTPSAYRDGAQIETSVNAGAGTTTYSTSMVVSDNQASMGAVTVIGGQSISGSGGTYMSSLTINDGATLTYDPVITPIRVESAPVFNGTGKLKLASRYAGVTCGKFHLVSYPSSASFSGTLANVIDSSSFAADVSYTVTEETVGDYKQLVLTVGDYANEAKAISIAQFGDSITEGIRRDHRGTPNYRIPLMQLLEAYGYRPETRGYRSVGSTDANGVPADDNYKWHTGISAQRIYTGITTQLRAGFMESIEAHLEQVGVTDIITLKIGTNDALGGETADNMFEGWSNLVWKIVRMRPTSKIVVCTPVTIRSGENNAPGLRTKIAAYMGLTYEQGGFPNGQVTMVDGFAAVTDDANYYLGDNVHPNWNGHMQLANAWLPAVMAAYESMDGHHAMEDYPAQTFASASAEAVNALADYRAGYVKLATFTNVWTKLSTWSASPYYYVNDAYTNMPMDRVAYFVARKTKASPDTRYVWVDMDADATTGTTLAEFGVPTSASVNGVVNNLHIYSNSSAIENVAPTVSGVKGTLMRTEKGVNKADDDSSLLTLGVPTGPYGFDWNDTIDDTALWGVMNIARIFDGATPTNHRKLLAAQMLFDFNGFNTAGNTNALGIGNFAVHGPYATPNATLSDLNLNWTFKAAMPTMDATALDTGVIEIWGKPAKYTTETITVNDEEVIVIIPLSDVAAIDIPAEAGDSTFAIPGTVTNITGVTEEKLLLKVTYGNGSSTNYYANILSLDGSGNVSLNSGGNVGGVSVTPAVDTTAPAPMAVSAAGVPTFVVKTIPGLWYAAEVSDSPSSDFAVDPETITQATETTTTLPAATAPTTGAKYYRIAVGASEAALTAPAAEP